MAGAAKGSEGGFHCDLCLRNRGGCPRSLGLATAALPGTGRVGVAVSTGVISSVGIGFPGGARREQGREVSTRARRVSSVAV